MASFVDKLRLNSLYPTLPFRRRQEEEANPFRIVHSSGPGEGNLPPMQQQRMPLQQIAEDALIPLEKRPGSANNMNVVYKEPSSGSDRIGMRIMGYDQPISPHQLAQLNLKNREIDIKEQTASNQAEYNRSRAANANRATDVAEFRARNPGARIVSTKGGNTRAYDPISGRVIADFGPSGEMSDSDRIDKEQAGRISAIEATGNQNRQTEGVQQTGRENLATLNQNLKPRGNTRVQVVRDAQGNIVESSTIKDEDVLGPSNNGSRFPQGQGLPPGGKEQSVLMYGPDGKAWDIPVSKTDDAQARGMKFKR